MASSKIYHRQFYGQISNPEGSVLHPAPHRQLSNSFSSYGSTGEKNEEKISICCSPEGLLGRSLLV